MASRGRVLGLLFVVSCTGTTAMDAGPYDAGVADVGPSDAPATDHGGSGDGPTADLTGCDEDGDGALSMACGGHDCDDHSLLRAPGHTEVCDVTNVDEDCDPTTVGMRDDDGDTYISAACCNAGATGALHCGDDCNDASTHTHPGAPELCDSMDNDCNGTVDEGASATGPEVCNGVDDNCNGAIDEGVRLTFYADTDGDGHGDAAGATMTGCSPPTGFVASHDDCNDTLSGVHPGAVELCDAAMVDEDCDGVANPGSLCSCTSGASRPCASPGACAAGIESCTAGAWGACSIGPVAETCNGIDDNCDGSVDEGLRVTCYTDGDSDTYAPSGAAAVQLCPSSSRPAVGGCPVGWTNRAPTDTTNIDCNDAASGLSPGAVELCNLIDDNCNGTIDEGCP